MTDKTNQDLYDKMIEGFNKVLADTQKNYSKAYDIFDLMEPTYNNVRMLFDKLEDAKSKISHLESKINSMEKAIEQLQSNLR